MVPGVGRKTVGAVALRNGTIDPCPCEEAHRLRSHWGQSGADKAILTETTSLTPASGPVEQTLGSPPFRMRPEALTHPGPLCSLCQLFL